MNNDRLIRVLLADDHQIVRHGIKDFLQEAGFQVIAEAEDGQQALNLIEARKPNVAVLDVQMPAMGGIEVARQVREKELPVGILMLTAYDDDPYVFAAIDAGVNGYVLKTADAEDIVNAVRAVYEGQSALDPAIISKVMKALSPSHQSESEYDELTDREMDVLHQAARGLTNKAIGRILSISDRTVQGHLRRVYDKLHVTNRTEAVVKAAQLGLLHLPNNS